MSDEQTVVERDPRVRRYELLYLVANKYTEEEIPKIQATVNDLIKGIGGDIKKEVNYGKRRLAYPVDNNHYGYYLLSHFDMPSQGTKELNKTLRVQDDILRHLITIAIDEKSLGEGAGDLRHIEEEPRKEEKEREKKKPRLKRPSITDAKATEAEKEKIAKGSVFDLEKELGLTAAEAEVALESEGKDKSKKEESVDLEGLESKLDEIMSDLETSDDEPKD